MVEGVLGLLCAVVLIKAVLGWANRIEAKLDKKTDGVSGLLAVEEGSCEICPHKGPVLRLREVPVMDGGAVTDVVANLALRHRLATRGIVSLCWACYERQRTR